MVDFQFLLEVKTKVIRNTSTFFILLVCGSLHPLKCTYFRHSDKVQIFALKNLSPL